MTIKAMAPGAGNATLKVQGGNGGTGIFKVNGTLNLTGAADVASTFAGGVIAGALNVGTNAYAQNIGTLTLLGTSGWAAFLTAKSLTVGAGTVDLGSATDTTYGGTYASGISLNNGASLLNVNAGNWTVDGTLTQSNGAIVVDKGSLSVNKLAHTAGTIAVGGRNSATLTVKDGADGSFSTANAINVNNQGTLAVKAGAIITGGVVNQSARFTLTAGATLEITGFTGGKVALVDLAPLKAAAGLGMLSIGNTEITGLTMTDGGYNYTDVGGISNDQTMGKKVNVVTGTATGAGVGGGFQSVNVTGGDGTSAITVNVTGTLHLAGRTAGVQLVTGTTGVTHLAVGNTSALTLGQAGKSNIGTLNGNVAMSGAGSLLTANSGTFTVKDITAASAGDGNVLLTGSNGHAAMLKVGNVGTALVAVNSVTINSGSMLAATGVVNTQTAHISEGSLLSTGNMSIGTATVNGMGDATKAVVGSTGSESNAGRGK